MNDSVSTPTSSIRLPVIYEPAERVLQTWLELLRAFSVVSRQLDAALAAHGLSLAQFDVLATLHVTEGITQQELAKRLLVTKGNVCGLIDRMEASGWLLRRPDPKDRRANRLVLTDAGRDLIQKTFPEHQAILARCFADLSMSQVQDMQHLLDRITRTATP